MLKFELKIGSMYRLVNGDVVRLTKIDYSYPNFPIEGVYVESKWWPHTVVSWTKNGRYCMVEGVAGSRDIVEEFKDWGELVELDMETV